jgi:hypothetical protein
MSSGLREIELLEHGVVDTQPPVQHASHVVGIDESGNHHDGPFVMTAVQCPRSHGELLAELLIELGLEPWKSKSSSTPRGMSGTELSGTIEQLLSSFDSSPITWHAVAGWGTYTVDQRAATACIVASKALTGGSSSVPEYEGPAALVHDGGSRMYGSRQELFRRAATRQFNGFGDRVTQVYITQLQHGDLVYPEITAADYIAGYIRIQLPEVGIEGLGYDIQRIDDSWNVSDDPPSTLYSLRSRNRRQSQQKHDRAAAWIEGRRPSSDDVWGHQPLHSLANRLQSDVVQGYLLDEL